MRIMVPCLLLVLAASGCVATEEGSAVAAPAVTVRWSEVGWELVGIPDVRALGTPPELAARIDRAERELAELRPCCGPRAQEIARQLAAELAAAR